MEGGPHDAAELGDELAVVALLKQVRIEGPDQATRERMRQRILTAEPPTPLATRRISARARLAVAAAAVLCLIMSLAGMSVLLSRDALPGDPLYGVKRTAESASLGFVFNDESRALKHLEFAAARITEMEALAERGARSSDHLTALTDHDADATEGTRELTTYGTNGDGRVLASLRDWAQSQTARLTALRPRLPADVVDRANGSLALLGRIAQRADELDARTACSPITSGETDGLGPLPAQDCSKIVVDPNASSSRIPSTDPTTPGSSSGTSSPSVPGSPPQQAQPTTPGQLPLPLPPVNTPSTQPGITIPLPLPLPSISLPGLPGISFGN
ncbi:hypothetical protein Lesp02_29020 [Lentzea sp. NBRC 105346]|nr:hypothetical protein Lesp02_29020 [Lentzea sp. NBRC 105346]